MAQIFYIWLLVFFSFLTSKISYFLAFSALLDQSTGFGEILEVTAYSLRFDVAAATVMTLLAAPSLVGLRTRPGRLLHRLAIYYVMTLFILLCLLQLVDINYFAFYQHRFNDYLWEFFADYENVALVAHSIRTSLEVWPTLLILISHIAILYSLSRILMRSGSKFQAKPSSRRSIGYAMAGFAVLLISFATLRQNTKLLSGTHPKHLPTSSDPFLNHIDTNSAFALHDSYENFAPSLLIGTLHPKLDYPSLKTTWEKLDPANRELKLSFAADAVTPHSIVRPYRGLKKRPRKIVLITMESLNKWPLDSKDFNAGSALDSIRGQAAEWSNYFAPGHGTISNNLKINLGLPLSPHYGKEVSYQQIYQPSFPSLPRLLEREGWTAQYLYGGALNWEGFGGILSKIGFQEVRGEEMLPSAPKTQFGLHDDDIYEGALQLLDKGNDKQFLQIMTLSNHIPYEIPHDERNARSLDVKGTLLSRVIDEGKFDLRFFAFRYSVEALSRFIEKARVRPWFSDTLFIVTADHGIEDPSSGMKERPFHEFLETKRIPLIIYAPDILSSPHTSAKPGNHIDLMPTIMATVIDHEEDLPLFGESLWEEAAYEDANAIVYGDDFTCQGNHCLFQDIVLTRKDESLRICPAKVPDCSAAGETIARFRDAIDEAGIHFIWNRPLHAK